MKIKELYVTYWGGITVGEHCDEILPENLESHLSWLKEIGATSISVEDYYGNIPGAEK